MAKQINTYRLAWNIKKGHGKIEITFVRGRSKKTLPFSNGMEFQAVANILQNEDPVFFDPQKGVIYTGDELVMDDD